MSFEKSAGAIIFRKEKDKILYLLLHYPSGARTPGKDYWDFPKGHIEGGENLEETVRREIKEETGLEKVELVPGFKKSIKYFFRKDGKDIFKIVTFFLAQTESKEIKISFEHIGFVWLSYEEALAKTTFKNAREVLTAAHHSLTAQRDSQAQLFDRPRNNKNN